MGCVGQVRGGGSSIETRNRLNRLVRLGGSGARTSTGRAFRRAGGKSGARSVQRVRLADTAELD